MRPRPTLRRLTQTDVVDAAAVLGRAFVDNPSWRALLPYLSLPERLRPVTKMHVGLVRATLAQGDVTGAFVDGALAGVSLVLPPGRYPLRAGAFRHMVVAALQWKTLRAIPHLLAIDAWQSRNHLKDPHYYLFVLGVEPALQGRGVGGALLDKIDAEADRDGVDAYLETDKEENLAIYRRHGYEVVHEETLALGAPLRVWTMRRDRRRSRSQA
jgi:ribosomal protein S18 acetylase RimI-like enzyme